MPLIQSGSKKAFQKNVETEMKANQGADNRAKNLAIAYAVRRKNANKMAKGGMAKNEDLNPGHEAMDSPEDLVLKEQDFDVQAEEHEDLNEPSEPMEHVMAAEEDMPAHMLSQGGIAKSIMKRRMARGGMSYPVPKDNHYADGGLVDEDPLASHEEGMDDWLSAEMNANSIPHEDHLQKKEKRKKMISSIMSGLHEKHLGK